MKHFIGIGLLAAALLIAAALSACGGDGEKQIRTEKGLGVGLTALAAQEMSEAARGGHVSTPLSAPSQARTDVAGRGEAAVSAVAQQSLTGITVQGYGSATADADAAILELYFGRYYAAPGGDQARPEGETPSAGVSGPITEADLQPVIDAIAAAGVAREDIEFLGTPYYDPYSSSATLRAAVRNIGIVGAVVQAATDAATRLPDILLQGTYVSYTVGDCAALERAATEAAVADARERAAAFAPALGAGLGGIAGAATYAWAPFGGSPCDMGYVGPLPLGGAAYSEGQPRQVQVYSTVTVTFEIR